MSDPIDRAGLTPGFWERKPLNRLSRREWEALCDGCGKCCLNKLEFEDTGEVVLTRVACRLLDDSDCRCTLYPTRHRHVPECIVLKPGNLTDHLNWIPSTCAYRLVHEGRPLYSWHPLISGTPDSVHAAGVSVQGRTLSEFDIPEEDWEDHIIEEPT